VEGRAVLHERDAAVGGREIVLVRVRGQIFLEQRPIGLVAVGVHVRDVVGNDIHLPFQHHLLR
jgi:hypothetical protein